MLPLELRQKPSPDGLTVTWTRRKEKKRRSFWHWLLPWKAVWSIEMRLLLHFDILNYKVFLLVCVCAPPNLNCTQICLKNEIWHYDFSSHSAALPSNTCMQPLRLKKTYKTKLPACLHRAIMVNQTTMLWEWSTINVFRSVRGQWVKQDFGCMFWNESSQSSFDLVVHQSASMDVWTWLKLQWQFLKCRGIPGLMVAAPAHNAAAHQQKISQNMGCRHIIPFTVHLLLPTDSTTWWPTTDLPKH